MSRDLQSRRRTTRCRLADRRDAGPTGDWQDAGPTRRREALCRWCWRLAVLAAVLWHAPKGNAAEIQSVCRLKGQEPVRLIGLGLVTGLNGTGDTRFTPMHSAAAQALGLLGNPVQRTLDVATIRNVALVNIACEIPAAGGREGDAFDCFVTSIGTARSLRGGRLMQAVLKSPVVADDTAYALAEGPITLEDPNHPNHARVHQGVTLTQDLYAPFIKCSDRVTLVIDSAHATFVTSRLIANTINRTYQPQVSADGAPVEIALALDARNIEVLIPPFARRDPVAFVSDIMQIRLPADFLHTEARVLINEKTGAITVTGEVELKPVLITHKNLFVFPGGAGGVLGAAPPNPFAPLTHVDATALATTPELANLRDLLAALDKAQVSAQDKIAIVKELAKSGKLHARVSFE